MQRVAIVNQSKVPSSTATCLWETASSHNHIATACCSRTSRPKIILFSGSWLMAFSSANFPYLSLTQGQLSPFTASHSKSFLWFPDTLCKGILSPVCFGSSLFFLIKYYSVYLATLSSFSEPFPALLYYLWDEGLGTYKIIHMAKIRCRFES